MAILAIIFGLFHKKLYCSKFERYNVQKLNTKDIKDTIKGFNMIMDGELDHLPEAAFNLKGTIEEAIEAGEKMIAEAK